MAVSCVRSRVLFCSSIAALSASLAAPAWAACSPPPTSPPDIVCSGTTANGIIITDRGTGVRVDTGATVAAGSADAAFVTEGRRMEFQVNGIVDGGGKPGIITTPGSPADQGDDLVMLLTVSSSGVVRGDTAVQIGQTAGNTDRVPFYLDNSGTLTGTSGTALLATTPDAVFQNFTNRSNGVINGGIVGTVLNFSNSGTIDGGSSSAIRELAATVIPSFIAHSYDNSGTIRSNGAAPTLDVFQPLAFLNSGAITNDGSGTAIRSVDPLTLDNRGTIGTAGTTAIDAGPLALTNSGTINGDIVVTSAAGTTSTIVNTAGMINGDIRFGDGDDVYRGRTDALGNFIGLSGSIDGGAGVDTVFFDLAGTRTVDDVTLPTNFERLGLTLVNNAQITVANTPGHVAGYSLAGSGGFTINTALNGSNPLIVRSPAPLDMATGVALTNNAAMTINLASPAIGVDTDAASFTNNGTISVTGGDGVRFGLSAFNNGSITASGTAVAGIRAQLQTKFGAFLTDSILINQGSIRSTAGSGVTLERGTITNNGTIEGATNGVVLGDAVTADFPSTSLINTGTVIGTTAGVLMNGHNVRVTNESPAIIRGGVVATSTDNGGRVLINHGRIEGGIDFSAATGFTAVANVDGTVIGDIRLGLGDDLFATRLTSGSPFAGVSGTVDAGAGFDRIIYTVVGSATSDVSAPVSFEAADYQLRNGASLTLTPPAPLTRTLRLGGDGTVRLSGDIVTVNQSAIDANAPNSALFTDPTGAQLRIVNHATIDFTNMQGFGDNSAIESQYNTIVENAGTINVSRTGGSNSVFAMFDGQRMDNDGTINIAGGIALANVDDVVNNGTIRQAAGLAASGVASAVSLTNRGTISVDGFATSGIQSRIDNSGLLESRQGAAVGLSGAGLVITNSASGFIKGNGVAIDTAGATVLNQGTIIGDVLLGAGFRGPLRNNTYVAAPGSTLTGKLVMGNGNDIFLQRGSDSGITGTIDAGGGTDYYGRSFTTTTTYALDGPLPATFERDVIEASGTSTIVTVAGAPQNNDLYVLGDGAIVNQTDINGSIIALNTLAYASGVPMQSLTNAATVTGAISGDINRLVNSGTIGSSGVTNPLLISSFGAASLVNSGTIAGSAQGNTIFTLSDARGMSLANSGVIASSLIVTGFLANDAANGAFTITNSGTITGTANNGWGLNAQFFRPQIPAGATGNVLALTNSGTITASGAASNAVRVELPFQSDQLSATVVNTGQIIASGASTISSAVVTPSVGLAIDAAHFDTVAQAVNVTNTGTIVATGAGAVAVAMRAGPLDLRNGGTITGGTTVTVDPNAGTPYGPQDAIGGAILTTDHDDRIVNTGIITGRIDLGAGDDLIENRGQITGDAFLRGGDDRWIQLAAATLTGTADGGGGIDTLTFDATQGGTVDAARIGRYRNFERFEQVGNGDVSYSGMIPFDTINVDGGVVRVSVGESLATLGDTTITGTGAAVTVINDGTILGGVTLGTANDVVVANGVIAGDVALGAGNDVLVLQRPLDFAAQGGSGTDTVQYAGNATTPLAVGAVPEFENAAVSSGVAVVTSSESFGRVDVVGGRLTGMAGSTLSAQMFAVGAAGTFGSAGVVNGDVVVAGTLAPGASPGTMRVNGNVALASGSNSIFELTPTVYDLLLISGDLTIAAGSALTLTGDRPLAPGSALDLIVADTISGTFGTIVKPASILGFVAQRGNRIQLLGQFAIDPALGRPVREAIAYLNTYLVSGAGNAALLTQLPALIGTGGNASPEAFARLTPEPYANAWQIGVDNALSLIDAARDRPALVSGERGLFSFAEGVGSWRRQSGGDSTSRASLNSWGLVGGVGWSAGDWGVAAYVGYVDSRQTMPTLAARTDVDGYVGGVQASYRSGPLTIGGMLSFNVAKDSVRRAAPGGSVTSRHDMFGGMADLWASYQLSATIALKGGLSYVGLDRGVAIETGPTPFALRVASGHHDAVFVNGGIEWQGHFGTDTRLQPYARIGARYQIEGREGRAIATLPDGVFGLTGYGITRAALLGDIAAGLRYTVAPGLRLSAGYAGAWGKHDRQHRATAGLSFSF